MKMCRAVPIERLLIQPEIELLQYEPLDHHTSHSAIMVCFDGLLHEQSIEPTHMQIACIAEINHILQSAMALSTIKS
jgi:hypothetical protein